MAVAATHCNRDEAPLRADLPSTSSLAAQRRTNSSLIPHPSSLNLVLNLIPRRAAAHQLIPLPSSLNLVLNLISRRAAAPQPHPSPSREEEQDGEQAEREPCGVRAADAFPEEEQAGGGAEDDDTEIQDRDDG